MKIYTLVNPPIDSNTYVLYLTDAKNAIIIDPFNAKMVIEFINKNDLFVDYVIFTHEHYDHIAGGNGLRNEYGFRYKLITSEACNVAIQNPKLNLSSYYDVLLSLNPKYQENSLSMHNGFITKPYKNEPADIVFNGHLLVNWHGHKITLIETPGHSKGSICVYFDDLWLFTGDSLFFDIEVTTRLPGGNAKIYNEMTLPFLKSLPFQTQVYPGHGKKFMTKQIKEI